MKHLGKFLPSGQKPNGAGGKVNPIDKARAANYAATKMEWALQVAADSDLSETAYRIGLAGMVELEILVGLAFAIDNRQDNRLRESCGAQWA
jgi:hypothetical protein